MFYVSEKVADAKAKAAVKAQIEADKKARAEKAAREKALREGQPVPDTGAAGPSQPTATVAVAGKDFKETRLQIRMSTGGQPYTTTLSSDARMSFDIYIYARYIHSLASTTGGRRIFGRASVHIRS